MEQPLRIAVFGVGGLGGFFASRLMQAGQEVALIARGEHLKTIQERGLTLATAKGDIVTKPWLATNDPLQVGAVDLVVLGTKMDAAKDAIEAIRPMVGPETGILVVQNGVEAPLMASAAYGENHVLASTVYGGGQIVAPGKIAEFPGGIFRMQVGELTRKRTARVEQLVAILNKAGIPAVITDDIQVSLWAKFGTICTASSVGAVTRVPAGIYRNLPGSRALYVSTLQECQAVAQARGITLPASYVADMMSMLDGLAPSYTVSMQRDIMEGRPSELEYQLGTLVRFGQEAGVPTPASPFMYAALLPQEMKARAQI